MPVHNEQARMMTDERGTPIDVPTGGRIAQLMDPQGAAFALHQTKG